MPRLLLRSRPTREVGDVREKVKLADDRHVEAVELMGIEMVGPHVRPGRGYQ